MAPGKGSWYRQLGGSSCTPNPSAGQEVEEPAPFCCGLGMPFPFRELVQMLETVMLAPCPPSGGGGFAQGTPSL